MFELGSRSVRKEHSDHAEECVSQIAHSVVAVEELVTRGFSMLDIEKLKSAGLHSVTSVLMRPKKVGGRL